MVSTVITFTKPDVQPPVYIAGGFTDWAPVEMQCESSQSGQNKFTHTTELQPGEHQYKFRLGPGDWWVLDESAPTGQYHIYLLSKIQLADIRIADDGSGNINNALSVTAEETEVSSQQPTEDVSRASVPAAPLDTLAAVEEELEVRPDTVTAAPLFGGRACYAPGFRACQTKSGAEGHEHREEVCGEQGPARSNERRAGKEVSLIALLDICCFTDEF